MPKVASKPRKPGSGGARAGAGRKKVGDILKLPIERLKADIEMLAPLIGPSLRELVQGIYVEEHYGKGLVRVYQQPPNVQAIQEVLNRTMGKVTDKIEHSGELTLSVKTLEEIKARAGN